MADGKWIDGLTAETPIVDAARRVLTIRLTVVGDHLPLAMYQPEKDPEHVHQLRVATRRAAAALRIFKSCLPARAHKTARKRLRQLRRSAGEARDWDVFLGDLSAWAEQRRDTERPGLDCLFGYAVGQRLSAQEHLTQAGQEVLPTFEPFVAETVDALQRPDDELEVQQLGDLARPLLSGVLHDLDEAAGQDLNDYDNLHQVRIAGKRLRYAMEIFVGCFPPVFKDKLYAAIEQMQEILGNANDSHVAGQRLAALRDHLKSAQAEQWKRLRLGIEGLLRHHQRRLPQERKRFETWWNNWQKSGNEAALRGLVQVPHTVGS